MRTLLAEYELSYQGENSYLSVTNFAEAAQSFLELILSTIFLKGDKNEITIEFQKLVHYLSGYSRIS